MVLHLTLASVTRATEEVIGELGDQFVYRSPFANGSTGCVYINPDTGEMSCLIGRVLHRLGAPTEWFTECSVDTLLTSWGDKLWVTLEPGVQGYLSVVQGAQDRRLQYGHVRLVGDAYLVGRRHALGTANE